MKDMRRWLFSTAGTSSLVAAIMLLGVTAGTLAADSAGGVEIKTEHYDLYCEGPGAEEYGRLLEQLYVQLKDYFGAEPKGRMRVKMLADTTSYIATLKAAGVKDAATLDFSGGVYYTGLKVAFVKRRASRWLTSDALVHECLHQFQCLACTKDHQFPSSWYYAEGLARYFEFRHWDGETLQTATVTMPYDEKIQRALDRFRSSRKSQLRNIIIDPGYTDPNDPKDMDEDEGYLFVRFLIEQIPAEFHALAARLDQREDPGAAWDATIGKSPLNLNERYDKWLSDNISVWPFQVARGSWVPHDEWIEGTVWNDSKPDEKIAISTAMLFLRNHVDSAKLQVRNAAPNAEVGVEIGAVPDGPFWLLLVGPDGQIAVCQPAKDDQWTIDHRGKMDTRPPLLHFSVRWDGDQWIVQVENGSKISIPAPASARIAAAVNGPPDGRAEFEFDKAAEAPKEPHIR